MKTKIIKNTWLQDYGWGNGYVLIPEGHKYYGIHYNDIPVDVHGGLTFSELITENSNRQFNIQPDELNCWMVGFDTCHFGDSPDIWTKEAVQEEANHLKEQLEKL